jgi:hypothetical protein
MPDAVYDAYELYVNGQLTPDREKPVSFIRLPIHLLENRYRLAKKFDRLGSTGKR